MIDETVFPLATTYQGRMFYQTGKFGKRTVTGERAAEYESRKRPGWIVWMTSGGEIYDA